MARSMLTGSAKHFLRTGDFKYVKDGSGHRAGENWANAKNIDPYSRQKRYSKNSPSFDTGVWWSKKKRQVQDMARRKARGEKVPGAKDIPALSA